MKKSATNLIRPFLLQKNNLFQNKQQIKQQLSSLLVIQSRRTFSDNLYSKKLQDLRKSIRETTNEASEKSQERKQPQNEQSSFQEQDQDQQIDPSQDKSNTYRSTGLFDTKQSLRGNDPYRADIVYSLDLEQVLQAFKSSLNDKYLKASFEFYNACLDRINQIITERDSKVGKTEVIQILRELSYYRPKEEEQKDKMRKKSGLFTQSEIQDDILSVRHKELITESSEKFQTVPGHMLSFVYSNLSKGFFKNLFTQYDDEQQTKFKTSLYQVLASYIQLYQNLEIRVIDMIGMGHITDSRDSLDILVSYSVAEEGTNTLYLKLIDLMVRRKEEYNMVEIEMVLNYFPHSIWINEESLTRLRELFYFPIILKIQENIDRVDKRQFLSLFQGMTLAGEQVFKADIINIFLNSYVKRINPEVADKSRINQEQNAKLNEYHKEQQFNLQDVMSFFELLVQFLRSSSPNLRESVDTQALVNFTNQQYFKKQQIIDKLSLNQVSGLYWVYHNTHAQFDQQLTDQLEERICKLLREELLLQKQLDKDLQKSAESQEGLQTMNVYDLEVLEHYYNVNQDLQEKSKRGKEILKLIKQAKHWDKPENERKWFHI